MKMIRFCGLSKWLKSFCFLTFLSIFSFGCSNQPNNQVEMNVIAFQSSIDSLLEQIIVPMQTKTDSLIASNSAAGKDTFQLARQRIPVTKTQFLISNEYYVLDSLLVEYRKKDITVNDLENQLKECQFRVDSLVVDGLH